MGGRAVSKWYDTRRLAINFIATFWAFYNIPEYATDNPSEAGSQPSKHRLSSEREEAKDKCPSAPTPEVPGHQKLNWHPGPGQCQAHLPLSSRGGRLDVISYMHTLLD